MTDNMKKFLENISEDKEFIEKLNKAGSEEAVIRLAAEKGFTLTEEDLKPSVPTGELSADELDAVAGRVETTMETNGACGCVVGGGGKKTPYGTQLEESYDTACNCFVAGTGRGFHDYGREGGTRCFCFTGGGGASWED